MMVRPAIIYMAGDIIHFQGGFNFFYTWENDLGLSEFRSWQGMNVFFPRIGKVHINNFFRLEQRFFYNNKIELPNFLRGRYMISANIPINKHTMSPGAIYLWPSFELFADLAGVNVDTFVTRERFSMGVGYEFSNRIRTEIVYMHERARDEIRDPFELENNVFRGIFRYSLPFRNN